MRSRLAARLLTLAIGSLLAIRAPDASAHPNITGYSGKPYNGVSETCTTNCHAKGGAAPTLTITVPATVQAGSTSAVTIVVAGNKTRTSMNAAFSDGVKTIKGANTDTPLAAQEPTEIAAVAPPPSGATGTYAFSFIAPSTSGTITMWVAGMAASGAGTGGDGVANATRTIMVTGAAVPDAGSDAGATPDAGPGTGSDAGDPRDAGSSGTGASGGNASGSSSGGASDTSGGCSVSTAGRTSMRGAMVGNVGASLAALALLVACRRRRRIGNSDRS